MDTRWLSVEKEDLSCEWQQLEEEGKQRERLQADYDALMADTDTGTEAFQTRGRSFLDAAQQLPMHAEYPYTEPSDLDGIRSQRPPAARTLEVHLSEEDLFDRIYGAWLGRSAGCLLGKPIEGMHSTKIWPYLQAIGKFPLREYFRSDESADVKQKYGMDKACFLIDGLSCMPEDDDMNYTVCGLAILKKYGNDFSPADVGAFWLNEIPFLHTCTAERIAYRNIAHLIMPPTSATLQNPYREWIGAQIRADFFGYVCPGQPERAAEFAWRDASISHVKNGIYGEIWVAAMLAAAPVMENVQEILRAGLAEIPSRCRLAEAIGEVMHWHQDGVDADEAIRRIHEQWDEKNPHHWCHTISNAQIVALGLLWSGGDFETAICLAVQACFDTDCNGATVGSVMGMMLGAKALPEKWIAPLNDRIMTGVAGYTDVRISALAREGFELIQPMRT